MNLLWLACQGLVADAILKAADGPNKREKPYQPATYEQTGYFPASDLSPYQFDGPISLSEKWWGEFPSAGFNPSLAAISPKQAQSLHPQARYIATLRLIWPQCDSLGTGEARARDIFKGGTTALMLLNASLNPLATGMISNLGPNVQDARLSVDGDDVFIGYVDGVFSDDNGGTYLEPRGGPGEWGKFDYQWNFARLEITSDRKRGKVAARIADDLKLHTKSGSNKIVRPRNKNIGAVLSSQRDLYLLEYAETDATGPQLLEEAAQSGGVHNGGNPLFLPEKNAYLGVGHTEKKFARPGLNKFYFNRFFLMDAEPPFKTTMVGPTFVMPALQPAQRKSLFAEAFQFITSVTLDPDDLKTLMISYGVNDCEAALVRIPLEDVLNSLAPHLEDRDEWFPSFTAAL